MLLTDTPGAVERLKFFSGQRLFAADLQALEDFNRDMRWLHNRSLHQVGIASGYAITANKGDREVTVGPGYAIDSRGREIVLTESRVLPVPPVANDGSGGSVFYDLTVRYDIDPKESETRDGVCVARNAVRFADAPIFCWITLGADVAGTGVSGSGGRQAKVPAQRDDIANGVAIRVARVEVLNCRLNSKPSIAERQNARPPAQRYLAAGGDRPDAKGAFDRVWRAPVPPVPSPGITLETSVDTRAANFQTSPDYVGQVIGERAVDVTIGGGITVTLLLDGFVRVASPTATGFDLRLLIPGVLIDPRIIDKVAKALPDAVHGIWGVEWLGIEA